MQVEVRWAGADPATARKDAEELVALQPDVIMATGVLALQMLLSTTRSVRIVFNSIAADPVGSGYVDTLARPGGNATGFVLLDYALTAKWMELLKEIAPTVTRVAVLRDPELSSGVGQFIANPAAPLLAAARLDVSHIGSHLSWHSATIYPPGRLRRSYYSRSSDDRHSSGRYSGAEREIVGVAF